MSQIIKDFQALHLERGAMRLDAMRGLVEVFQEQRKRHRGRVGFNTFALLNVGTDEVTHSAFLARLLDAEGGHGQGNMFLRAFLEACRPRIPLAPPDQYQVQTEFSGVESRIDILVYRAGQCLFYIENKTVSAAMPDQHDREFRDMRRAGEMLDVPEAAQCAIYLTPTGRRAIGDCASHWYRVSYRNLGRVFDGLLPCITENKVGYIVADWLDTLTQFVGPWRKRMMGFSDESLLVAENWRTVLDIVTAQGRLDEELTETLFSLQADLNEQPWWEQGWEFYTGRGIYILNGNWRTKERKSVLWMGVYNFDADHVFGLKAAPLFYIRTRKGHDELKYRLIEQCRAAGYEAVDDKWYFVRLDIQKCVAEHEAIVAYPDAARRQILDLFAEYSQLIMDCGDIIQAYLEELA